MTEPLSNSDINSMLRHINMFVGTYPSDIVPVNRRKYPQAFVINTAPEKTSGDHWTALILSDENAVSSGWDEKLVLWNISSKKIEAEMPCER